MRQGGAERGRGGACIQQRIIDATAAHCVAYKPNLAFYESLGADGLARLRPLWTIFACIIRISS